MSATLLTTQSTRAAKSKTENTSPDRQLAERLKLFRKRVMAQQKKAVREAFTLADECANLRERMTKGKLLAFLKDECQIPRTDALSYLCLPEALGADRQIIEESGTDAGAILRIAKAPQLVRAEAITMLRSGRSLSNINLRHLRRDILANIPNEEDLAAKDLVRGARQKAKEDIESFRNDLAQLANDFADLYNETAPDDRSQEAQDRVAVITASAGKALRKLRTLVPASELIPNSIGTETSWASVDRVLDEIAAGRLCLEEDWSWPDLHPLFIEPSYHATLLWALGAGSGHVSPLRSRPVTKPGIVPLDLSPKSRHHRPSRPYRYSVLELCAGAGGQAIGLHAAGFHHVGLVEQDPDAAATLRSNKRSWPVVEGDITTLDLDRFKSVDLIAGGLPCQPYSQAGEGLGALDERDLFDRALDIVEALRPKAVMIENVTGIMQVTHSGRRLTVRERLAEIGYEVDWRILAGGKFGLAQNRQRAILVAMRDGNMHRFRWPKVPGIRPTDVGSLLYDLMAARGWAGAKAWADTTRGMAPTLIGGSKKKNGLDLAQPKSRKRWLELGVDPSYVSKDAPGPDFVGMPRLTLEMCARLQDFPDEWTFEGNRLSRFRQIANAFPPRMARMVGLSIQRALSGEEVDLHAALKAPLFQRIDVPELAKLTASQRDENDEYEQYEDAFTLAAE
ncbi:DNA (cytosine-5-)-methyltransferase [Aurantimonas sp. A2-1-M11]|uniref:DNA cytosine methyltransferase n=1 Tax=Aurantimonas sp. A2-1-M11 TaxID=3113712 RepID=UPI002F95197C